MSRRSSSKRRSYRVGAGRETIEQLAGALVERHAAHIDAGFQLSVSSGIWRRKDGRFTARFVYRRRLDDGVGAIAYTIRGLS